MFGKPDHLIANLLLVNSKSAIYDSL